MSQKNILYIGAMGMGDNILSIPFFIQNKKKGNYITFLRYHDRYMNKGFHNASNEIIDFLQKNNLVDDILYIPYNKPKLLSFIIQNIRKFDNTYIPTKTFFSNMRGFLLAKNKKIFFDHINDNSKYDGLVQGLLENNNINSLYSFGKNLKIPYNKDYKNKYKINTKFITIFPSIYERSIDAIEWQKIISFLEKEMFQIVFIGGNREQWLYEDLGENNNKNIINLCGKTTFTEICSILTDSHLNISANGGIMWLGHLLNKHNISFHTVSGYITEPPVDNIHSFNIREYKYSCGFPCEAVCYRCIGMSGIPSCQFAGTEREGECRKSISGEDIIEYIKKII